MLAQRFANRDAWIDHYEMMLNWQIQKRQPSPGTGRCMAEAKPRTAHTALACKDGPRRRCRHGRKSRR